MVGLAMNSVPADIQASCAICGAPPSFPECPHEGERLELALDQAMDRWTGYQRTRDWVLNHARNQIIATFQHLRTLRLDAHRDYLQSLPCYTLYHMYNGKPPLQPGQLQYVHAQIAEANARLQQGIDEDWRASCQRYPEVLDYFFGLVDVAIPADRDPAVREPRFGAAPREQAPLQQQPATRRGKERRDSAERGRGKEHHRKERRRSTGREITPSAPMPPGYRRDR